MAEVTSLTIHESRLEKDKQKNPTMIIGGFIDGRLIYIFRFPFNSEGFIDRLESQLKNKFPDGDQSGYFLRSASFSFTHYRTALNLEVDIFIGTKELELYKKHFTGKLYRVIEEHIEE